MPMGNPTVARGGAEVGCGGGVGGQGSLARFWRLDQVNLVVRKEFPQSQLVSLVRLEAQNMAYTCSSRGENYYWNSWHSFRPVLARPKPNGSPTQFQRMYRVNKRLKTRASGRQW